MKLRFEPSTPGELEALSSEALNSAFQAAAYAAYAATERHMGREPLAKGHRLPGPVRALDELGDLMVKSYTERAERLAEQIAEQIAGSGQ